MKLKILPGPAKGSVTAPPSKSYSHRHLIAAALAEGESVVENVICSQDILATVDALSALGATVTVEHDRIKIVGCGGKPKAQAPLACRESGSTLRFLIPLALLSGQGATFSGTPRLIERGIGVYETLFAEYGISFSFTETSIEAKGRLTPSHFCVKGEVSSQFISGLLFALPLLSGDSIVTVLPPVESRSYIDITLHVLAEHGIQIVETAPNTFSVKGGQTYQAGSYTTEGDWSNAAFLYALNELGGEVKVEGVDQNSLQGDAICLDYFARLSAPDAILDVSDCPDLAPILFAVAAAKGHGATFVGTKRLKIKESDRASAMAEELQKMGITLLVEDNRVTVRKGTLTPPESPLSGHNDHRIVMALSVLLTRLGGEIESAEAVRKSYPDFFEVLKSLGIEAQYVTE